MELLSINLNGVPRVRLIGHVHYSTPWSHFPRKINEYILYIVKSGELYINEGGREYSLKKDDVLLLEPNILHKGYKEACCQYYFIHFKHPEIKNINNLSNEIVNQEIIENRKASLKSDLFSETIPTSPICYLPKHYHYQNTSELFEILSSAENDFYSRYENYKEFTSWKLSELLLKICREFVTTRISMTSYSKAHSKAAKILSFINNNYSQKISSSEIEEMFESNYNYLNRIFHNMTGYTIFNYLNMVRITKAKELMVTTPLKFSEIAYLVGIDDPYYFSKLFKKITSMTPTQYQNDKCSSLP